jgi:hypothetical protein
MRARRFENSDADTIPDLFQKEVDADSYFMPTNGKKQ